MNGVTYYVRKMIGSYLRLINLYYRYIIIYMEFNSKGQEPRAAIDKQLPAVRVHHAAVVGSTPQEIAVAATGQPESRGGKPIGKGGCLGMVGILFGSGIVFGSLVALLANI